MLAFVLTYVLFVWTSPGQRAENAVLLETQYGRENLLGAVNPWLLVLTMVGVLLIALLRHRLSLAVSAAVVIAVSIGGGQVLKLLLLTRPSLYSTQAATHNSFPSGHVTAAAAIVLAGVLVLPVRWRPFAAMAGALVVSYVAVSTIELGWHRLSDTIGAVTLCGAVSCLVGARRTSWQAAVVAGGTPVLASVLGYLLLSLTDRFDVVLVITGVLSAVVVLALTWPLCAADDRALTKPLVAAG